MIGNWLEKDSTSSNVRELKAFLDGLSDAAVIVDRDLRPLAWNQAYMLAVGLRSRRFEKHAQEGNHCHDFFQLEVCKERCLAKRAFESGRTVRMDEIVGHSQYGSERPHYRLIVSTIPLRNEAGQVLAALEMYRDVTAEARIQERYKVLLERERERAVNLEEQVRARTADLEKSLEELRATRAQLVQSEKLSSLGQLVAGIAHEINNPINFIYGNTDFLRSYVDSFHQMIRLFDELELAPTQEERVKALKEELDYEYLVEDSEKLLKSIRSGAERAAAIIRDLRTFIHGGTEKGAPVNLARCIETTINLVQHEARERVKLECDFEPNTPQVFGNEGQIDQVLMNLLVNAVQAIEGHGTVVVGLRPHGDKVQITVKDDGAGMDEATQLKVFDPFFTTKPVGKGTGLGLSISYSIVDAHGGTISIRSEKGVGTTFTVEFPAYEKGAREQSA